MVKAGEPQNSHLAGMFSFPAATCPCRWNSPMKATVFDEPAEKFAGLSLELPGLGTVELTHILKQTTETTVYRISHPGVVVKIFDLGCGKPGEISYGPYLRFGLELVNFEDIMAIEELRRFVPAYYGANVVYEKEYAYIAMEYLEG